MSQTDLVAGDSDKPEIPAEQHRVEFSNGLDALREDVVQLGELAVDTIARGTRVLLAKDLGEAQVLIDGDDVLDALSLQIDEDCYHLLALQAPIASDLRLIMSSTRIVSELERSADLMANVCKAARRLIHVDLDPSIRGLVQAMCDEAIRLTQAAIDSYVNLDAPLAAALDDMDEALDDLHQQFIEAIFTSHHEHGLNLRAATQLALVGRYYERIGDHAVNIGQRVTFMITGWLPEHLGMARLEMRKKTQPPE
jgi:phosphate transport system protein